MVPAPLAVPRVAFVTDLAADGSNDTLSGPCLCGHAARPAGRHRHGGRREHDQGGQTRQQAAARGGSSNAHTALGAMAVGIGALLHNTAGGIAAFVFLLFVLPGITAILPHTTSDAINPYLPLNAGSAVATSTFDPGSHLSPWAGFAVFCGYTLVITAAAAVRLVRADA
jgi:hypothetical protein